jgi:UDP-2-acetamido-2,6-beta-L-arabino-hexul-4-ose reductase
MKILLTGAAGFLGWHTRVRLRALTDHTVVPVTRANWSELPELMAGADAVIHVAGINRAAPEEVERGNRRLAEDVVAAIRHSGSRPVVVFANSIHADADTPYGSGKRIASTVLGHRVHEVGGRYVDVRLPNLFGEHGRPAYNSFVATFVECIVNGRRPNIVDRPVKLMHVQQAATLLLEGLTNESVNVPAGTPSTVQEVYDRLRHFDTLYAGGDIPPLLNDLDLDLFNTLRAARFPDRYPIPLVRRSDHRGGLIEVVRAHGGQGQTFVSTTRPGITRGEHFHLRKVERFAVVDGRARIALRRMFDHRVVTFDVDRDEPVIVDMPTLWAHSITNTGDRELLTVFWTSDLFDSDSPDTFAEPVALSELVESGASR